MSKDKQVRVITIVQDSSKGRRYFRCAGYRRPENGEIYISKDAKVKQSIGLNTDGDRLIVREITGFNTIQDYGDRGIKKI